MCEPLRGKIMSFGICKLDGGSNPPFGFITEDVKSAVEFYLKYRDNPHWFKMKFPNVWSKIPDNIIYEHWLFNYSFKDVVE